MKREGVVLDKEEVSVNWCFLERCILLERMG